MAAFIDGYSRVRRLSMSGMVSPVQFEAALVAKSSTEAEAA